jgi:hypothetical protein
MAQATYLRLRISDFWKGLFFSVGTAVSTALLQIIDGGEFPTTWQQWKIVLLAGSSAFLLYLIKNLFTNTKGQMFKKEPDNGSTPK